MTTSEKHHFPRCLILNSDNQLLSVCSWIRALRLSMERDKNNNHKVSVLSYYDDFIVQSENHRFVVPAVIRLNYWVNVNKKSMYQRLSMPSMKNILIRDNFTCQYCGKRLSFRTATKDHLIPLSKGGTNTIENIVSSCKHCNLLKSNLSLDEFTKKYNLRLLNKPRQLNEEEKIRVVLKFFKSKERKVWLKCLKEQGIKLW